MWKLAGALLVSASMALAGCTAAGAVAGGVAGHELTDGSAAGTIGGAARTS